MLLGGLPPKSALAGGLAVGEGTLEGLPLGGTVAGVAVGGDAAAVPSFLAGGGAGGGVLGGLLAPATIGGFVFGGGALGVPSLGAGALGGVEGGALATPFLGAVTAGAFEATDGAAGLPLLDTPTGGLAGGVAVSGTVSETTTGAGWLTKSGGMMNGRLVYGQT